MKKLLLLLALLAHPLAYAAPPKVRLMDIPSRPGVTVRVLLVTPQRPVATLLLFAGGERPLAITEDGAFGWGGSSLLVRISPLLVEAGLTIAIVDLPSDKQTAPLGNYRESAEHTEDIRAVITSLRGTSGLPLWLAGVSSGATSVLNGAVGLGKDHPDGVVFPSGAPLAGTFSGKLDEVRVPAVVMHKAADLCRPSDDAASAEFLARLKNSPKAEQFAVRGKASADDPCKPAPGHGLVGLERELASAIADWIKSFIKPKQYVLLEAGKINTFSNPKLP